MHFRNIKFMKQVILNCMALKFIDCLRCCHLAGELIKNLQRKKPELNITDAEVLSVQISAALCHDLGEPTYDLNKLHTTPMHAWVHMQLAFSMVAFHHATHTHVYAQMHKCIRMYIHACMQCIHTHLRPWTIFSCVCEICCS